ncbi:hypothetical protein [Propionicicella superfundia]|uniref:hypothetical protein n=1 Tax=Propionicicella superfundia TaxID=348582 RepID=UPI000417012B|nr:hypothetical protein [Propionicicella superfundia]
MRRLATVLLFVASCLVASLLVSVVPTDDTAVRVSREVGEEFVFEDGLAVSARQVRLGTVLTADGAFVARTADVFLVVDARIAVRGLRGGGTLDAEIVSGGRVFAARSSVVVPQAGFYTADAFVVELPREALVGSRLRLTQPAVLTSVHNVPEYDLGVEQAVVDAFAPPVTVDVPAGPAQQVIS